MKRPKPIDPALGRISTLGGLLGIKSGPLLARLAPLTGECSEDLVATIPHSFDALAVTVTVGRETARSLCGPWLEQLPGDRLSLELDATTVTAYSDEAALPPDAPTLVRLLGDDLSEVGWDGETWTYAIAQPNPGDGGREATIARIDQVAAALGVTEPQRTIAATLHRSLARGMVSRATVRARAGAAVPELGLVWERVEWLPIQHMLSGFYPALGGAAKIDRLSRALEVEDATVELVLGPADPPALRFSIRLAGV